LYHAVLSGIAQGDGKTHSSFKRAKVDEEAGLNVTDELSNRGVISVDKAKNIFTSWDKNEKVDNKFYFSAPFLRFWFAFVSPLFKGIRDGDFEEVKQRFLNNESEFTQLTFIKLSHELLKLQMKDDKIVEIGTYWDREVELDIYAKTQSGKTIVGSCKYTNNKVKKSELTRLQATCTTAKIEADLFVLISKKGFSSELKSLKGDKLKLFTLKHFKSLVA